MTGSASAGESAISLAPSLRTRVDRVRLRCNGRDFIVDCTVIQVYKAVWGCGFQLPAELCLGWLRTRDGIHVAGSFVCFLKVLIVLPICPVDSTFSKDFIPCILDKFVANFASKKTFFERSHWRKSYVV